MQPMQGTTESGGRSWWSDVRRVLAVRLDNIGDVVMLGPALRAVRAALPEAHLTLLASPAGTAAAPLLPWIDEVLTERAVWQDASGTLPLDPQREEALIGRLRHGRFDAAFVFTSFSQSPHPPAYACYLAGVPHRVGCSKEFGGALLTSSVPDPGDALHQVDRNLQLLDAVGIPVPDRHLEVHVPLAAQRAADALLAEVGLAEGRPLVVVAPGASAAARRYPADRLAELARLLAERLDVATVVVGSERDAALAHEIVAGSHGLAASLVGRTTVPELAGVIARASVVVANNSGPMHLADALRRPLVVPYSGTDLESQWEPRGAPARLLRRPTPCAPCFAFDCPYDLACLDIPAEELLAAVGDVLEASTTAPRRSSPCDRYAC